MEQFRIQAAEQYRQIAMEMRKMSITLFENRFKSLLACLSGKNLQNRNKQVLQELVEKIRYELNTTKRQAVIEELLDEVEIRLDKL